MSHAGVDLLLGARGALLAAALLAGCTGADDDASASGPAVAASVEGGDALGDAGPADASQRADARSTPPDGARTDVVRDVSNSSADVPVEAAKLALCLRLADPQDTNQVFTDSQTVGDQFLLYLQADCRVAKALYPPGGVAALAAWRNDLFTWNLDLWGCTKTPAVVFKLVSSDFSGWTNTDAQLLIDAYLRAATRILSLTVGEAADLRDDLQRLALVTNDASDSTLSTCPVDASASAEADAPAVVDASANAEADAPNVEAGAADADESSLVESGPGDADSALEEGGD